MSDPAEILYREAAPFERALARAASATLPIPIRQILDPRDAPAAFLPFQGAHESADLWFEDWPEERKRRMVEALRDGLADTKGTEAAAPAFLAFVDAVIVHKRAYPSRFPVGRIAAGITPVQHPTFTARYLVKVALEAPGRAVIVGRSAIGRAAVRTVDFEPIRRANRALAVSKADDTAYSVTYAHRVPVDLDTGFDLDAGVCLGVFQDRHRL